MGSILYGLSLKKTERSISKTSKTWAMPKAIIKIIITANQGFKSLMAKYYNWFGFHVEQRMKSTEKRTMEKCK